MKQEKESRIELHKPIIENHGIVSFHDYACPVCHEKHAVLDMSTYIFQPCWKCQERGFKIKKKIKRGLFERIFKGTNR